MEYQRALKIAIVVLEKKRREYAFDGTLYTLVKDPALEAEYKRWKELDDAIEALKNSPL